MVNARAWFWCKSITRRITRGLWPLGRQPAARLVARVLCVIQKGDKMERFAYLDTWDKLTPEVFKAVFHYAVNIAKDNNKELTLVVNNVAQCADFISKFVDQTATNKLVKGATLQFQDVDVTLKSPFSIKSYQSYGVFCAFHPSNKALDSMEGSDSPVAIVILGEQEEHLASWLNEKNGKLLAQG